MIEPRSPEYRPQTSNTTVMERALDGAKKGAWAGASFLLFTNKHGFHAVDNQQNSETPKMSLYKIVPTVIIGATLLGAVLNVFASSVLNEQFLEEDFEHKD